MITQFDIAVLIVIIASMTFGFMNGFIKTTISFIGYIISALLAAFLSDLFAGLFSNHVDSHASAIMLSSLMLFVIFSAMMYVANNIIFDIISSYYGNIIDKSFGICIGLIRGWTTISFVMYVAIFAIPSLDVKDHSDIFGDDSRVPKWAKNSETLLLLSRGAHMVSMIMPDKFSAEIKKSIDEANTDQGYKFFSNRTDDIRNIHKIFSMIPEAVLNEVPQQDLIDLQDQSFSPAVKIDILKRISDLYSDYVNGKVYHNQQEEEKANKNYHEVVTSIESEISKLNTELEDEE
jgi:uncharacterized membrane protein required for colicin V production